VLWELGVRGAALFLCSGSQHSGNTAATPAIRRQQTGRHHMKPAVVPPTGSVVKLGQAYPSACGVRLFERQGLRNALSYIAPIRAPLRELQSAAAGRRRIHPRERRRSRGAATEALIMTPKLIDARTPLSYLSDHSRSRERRYYERNRARRFFAASHDAHSADHGQRGRRVADLSVAPHSGMRRGGRPRYL
jgi:hypothetical protein